MASYFVREPLNGEEYNRLVNACETFREKLVIWSLLDMGLRVSEFCDLRRKDIQWQENQLVIWGKRKKLAFRKKRRDDAYTPGGCAGARPNRATIVYANLVRQAFPGVPVVIGGIEASMRRASHYDFWQDKVRNANAE